jgi:hypothetical protein
MTLTAILIWWNFCFSKVDGRAYSGRIVMEWRTVPGYPAYEVSDSGDVRRGDRPMKCQVQTRPDGYTMIRICLYKEVKKKMCTVARLVAQAFIPNPDNLPTVDHIDQDSTNNHVSNLRWASRHMQNMNRDCPIGASGHRNIHKRGNGWLVHIKRHRHWVYCKTFPTIESAIEARDMFLTQDGQEFH